MRFFKDGDALTLEPWRAQAFPVVRELVVDRSAFDRIIQAGGYISAPTGSALAAAALLVPKEAADTAFDDAACIGCGTCVVACPNAAAMLFTAAKVTHLNVLPQGQPERDDRALNMVAAMRREAFGGCSITASARPCARRASRWNSSPDSTETWSGQRSVPVASRWSSTVHRFARRTRICSRTPASATGDIEGAAGTCHGELDQRYRTGRESSRSRGALRPSSPRHRMAPACTSQPTARREASGGAERR
jgi:ferredoxin